VVQADKEGWKQADQLDIIEESREIEEKSKEKEQAALEISDTLSEMMMSRIRLSLKTPNAPLTSLDARRCLDGLITTEHVIFLNQTVRLRYTPSDLIDLLSNAEKECEMKDEEHIIAAEDLGNTKETIHRMKKDLEDVEKTEIWTDEAIELMSKLIKEAEEYERFLSTKEVLYQRTKVDAEAMQNEVIKKREMVRESLLFQEKYMNEIGTDTEEAGIGMDEDFSIKYEDVSYSNRMQQIERYLEEENDLIDKIASLEEEALQLRER